jgi:acetoin:2,6-dichlorophenolindophenol oxidoreductase subunit alpha
VIAPARIDTIQPGEQPAGLTSEDLVGFYREMRRVRAFEEQVIEAFADGLIPGSTHPCIGQEAIKAGVIGALADDDLVFATYRGHGEALVKGVEPGAMMAELMGRSSGICKGKGGSMHLSDPSSGLVSTNAIVAGHLPMAGGAALSCQLRKTNQVVVCFFGDGASCEGEFFETLNMAQLWRVPIVFVCENNGIAISVPTSKSQSTPDIADRATGFGISTAIVDGNDVVAVYEAAARGVEHARGGLGPYFIECKTVRWERHSAFSAGGSDAAAQREAWQVVDPIARLKTNLIAWNAVTTDELEAIDENAERDMASARAEAAAAPSPDSASIFEDIFAPLGHRPSLPGLPGSSSNESTES